MCGSYTGEHDEYDVLLSGSTKETSMNECKEA